MHQNRNLRTSLRGCNRPVSTPSSFLPACRSAPAYSELPSLLPRRVSCFVLRHDLPEDGFRLFPFLAAPMVFRLPGVETAFGLIQKPFAGVLGGWEIAHPVGVLGLPPPIIK